MSTLLLILLLHGLFLSVLIWCFGREHARARILLGSLVAAACLLLLEAWINLSGVTANHPHLVAVFQPFWFLVGPLAYLYTHASLGFPWQRRLGLLLVPSLLIAVMLLPFYLLPATEKLGVQARQIDVFVLYCGFWLLTGYCALRARNLIRTVQQHSDHTGNRRPWHLPWLSALMSWMFVYALVDCAATAWFLWRGDFPGFMSVISVLMLAAIIYGTGLLVVLPNGLLARSPWPGKRYQRSSLPDDDTDALVGRLNHLMLRERLWQNEALNPSDIADRLGLSTHQLSQLLNQHLGAGFNAYINRFRVEEAQRMLRDLSSKRSMMDIGLEAGFGSNATFYRVFRKQTGMTPREFLSEATQDNVSAAVLDSQSTRTKET